MKITALPIDVYRQAGAFPTAKNDAAVTADAAKAQKTGVITLPGNKETKAGAVAAQRGPSPFAGVLSTEEKTLLVKYFARFGDDAPTAPAYGVEARTNPVTFTGINLDVKV
ncbi:MAG: hypothetical protein PHR28_14665 [candidate division Zixibacteria bacterium]|nr:hypothetical protein [candidate division Zixibacteria bacterium]